MRWSGIDGRSSLLFDPGVSVKHAAVDDYGPPEGYEGIDEIIPVTPAEVADLIRTGELTDGFALAAYTRALLSGLGVLPR